ncbi:MAG: radical SAM protein, partial [Deltaproteobacteria bacterium]|nr:radical SAM protein [Deltaproteobacteria bacterium]
AIRARTVPMVSFERGRPLTDFEILAFSISFETDYLNLVNLLRMAGIPLHRADRAGRNYPLVIAGGSAIFLNPEPIADYVDLFLIGEGEEMVPEFLAAYEDARSTTGNEAPRLHDLARVEGAYLPDYFTPSLDSHGRIECVAYTGPGEPKVHRRLLSDLDRFSTSSLILTEESVFGDMFLVEASRGCQWGCRFCAAGFMYRPIRYRSPDKILAEAQRGLAERNVIGLVGAEMASVPGVAEIATAVADAGGRLSPSSLKADCISPKLAEALVRNGARSVTVAPEAGSERMRKVINKNLTENEILNAAEMLVGSGVESLKLYFMIGLPEERDDDLLEIANLTGRILERARAQKKRVGHVTVSLNPFVPKPWTPFQWDPMQDTASLKRKIALLRSALGRLGGASIELDAESPREAYFQTLVSRGDRRVGRILERLSERGCDDAGAIWHELRLIKREAGEGVTDLPNPDFYVTRQYTHDEVLPWDFIDHHIHKWFLLSERKKAHYEHQTKPCDVTRCTVCGAC